MNDYKELIAELKELSNEEKEFASNSGDIYCAERLALAADAIEQLVKERDASVDALKAVVANIDAELVVRCGEWLAKKNMVRSPYARNYYCSNCKDEPIECGKFCKECGAKMLGGE